MDANQLSILDDLEISVTQLNRERQIYYVKMQLQSGSTFTNKMVLDNLPSPPVGNNRNEITQYGLHLFAKLFDGRLNGAFRQALSESQTQQHGLRMRLVLDSDDPRLHAIPWELMHYDDGSNKLFPLPLATSPQIAFSRHLISSDAWGKPVDHRPVSMLVVISDPADLPTSWPQLTPVGDIYYLRELQKRFEPLVELNQIYVDFLPQIEGDSPPRYCKVASPEQIHAALDKGVDVVLYFGHALHHPELGTRLLLVNNTPPHEAVLYDGEDLVRRMKESREQRPRLMMLIACNTAVQSLPADTSSPTPSQQATDTNAPSLISDMLSSLAAQLVQEGGVPAVLAMQRLVDIELARTFTIYLSDQLSRHGIIDIAVNAARRHVYNPDSIAWSTPMLYMRTPDGRLFTPDPRLEYALKVLNNRQYVRWKGDDSPFIDLEVLSFAPGQNWKVLMQQPEDAPLAEHGIDAIKHLLAEQHTTFSITNNFSNLAVLIGSDSFGQEMMFLRLAVDLAEMAWNRQPHLSKEKSFADPLLGFVIPLESYENQRFTNYRLERLIIETISQIEPLFEQPLTSLLLLEESQSEDLANTKAPFVFLLNGLDKVSEAKRADIAEEIVSLAKRLPNHSFLVNCRVEFFPSEIFQHVRVLIIQPINERQVLRYLYRRNPDRSMELFRKIVENRLQELTTTPELLTAIYDHFAEKKGKTLTLNELATGYLEEAFASVPDSYKQGDAVRRTLTALAWHSRWQHQEVLSLNDVFSLMAQVRGYRDYNLEKLYQVLLTTNMLTNVGLHDVRFAHSFIQAYCAALELRDRPDWKDRVLDIMVMCAAPFRQKWWEETIYALVGLLHDPMPLLHIVADAALAWGGTHRLLAARCLAAMSATMMQQMSSSLRQKLFDACLMGMDSNHENSSDRRAAIITAVGSLHYALDANHPSDMLLLRALGEIEAKLFNILIKRVRWTSQGERYDYIKVRIAAARALRTRYSISKHQDKPTLMPQIQQIAENDISHQALADLFDAWYSQQRDVLRNVLDDNTRSSPERALAAFALGDIAWNKDDQDANQLLKIVTLPEHDPTDQDTIWAATDALTLFDARQVSRLLVNVFTMQDHLPRRSTEQIAYIAGRMRTHDKMVTMWLIKLLMLDEELKIKAKAIQSLAWLGQSLRSFDWLSKAIRSPEIEQTMLSLGLDTQVSPYVRVQRIIKNIIIWNIGYLTDIGFVKQVGPLAPDEEKAQQQDILYLRRKAIEALVWIGDQAMIDDLYNHIHTWNIDLRMTWYASTVLMSSRLVGQQVSSDE